MTTHVCRDFLTVDSDNGKNQTIYLTSLFLYEVMNFTIIGATNFDLPSFQVSSGVSASINLGPGFEDHVLLPGGHSVTPGDYINSRILTLRSVDNSMVNSGLFRIINTGSFSGSATLQIDYRSPDSPPSETNLKWGVYEKESTVTMFQGGNGNNENKYQTTGTSSVGSRIILQSSASPQWQVRLCYESVVETVISDSLGSFVSIAPGMSGTINGDFISGSEQLHGLSWFDSSIDAYLGSTTGFDADTTTSTANRRYYFWANETVSPGSFVLWCRLPTSTSAAWAAFGFCEDETMPLPPNTIQRMFTFGRSQINIRQSIPRWGTYPTKGDSTVVGFSLKNRPILGGISCWTPVRYTAATVPGSSAHPFYSGFQKDNPVVNATELMSNDVYVGTANRLNANSVAKFDYEARRLGRFPLAKAGRTEFGEYTTSTDTGKSWIHLYDGIYMPWSGSTLP